MAAPHGELPPDSIRLLHLLPGGENEALECSLTTVNIAHASSYEALSYLWGSPDHRRQVKCGHGVIEVTANGAQALLRVRSDQHTRVLWMDQVCINQSNLSERSRQVRLMSKIFSRAERVLMWLGPDHDQVGEIAKEFIEHLQSRWERPVVFSYSFEITFAQDNLPPPNDERWKALRKLMGLQYFTRVWMLQEVMLAADAIAFWGETEIAWVQIARAAKWGESSSCLSTTKDGFLSGDNCIMILQMLPSEDEQEKKLAWMIGLLSYRQSTDPRDKIFAIMDLVAPHERLPFAADYNMATVDVYRKTTEYIIFDADRSLNVMQNSTFTTEHPSRRNEEWPTWIPRWGDIDFPYICGVDSARFLPCDGHPLDAWLEDDGRALYVRGISAGMIHVQAHDDWDDARYRDEVRLFDEAWDLTRRHADPTLDTEPLVLQMIWTILCAEADSPLEGSEKYEQQADLRKDYGWSFIQYYYWAIIRRGAFKRPKDLPHAVVLALLDEIQGPFDDHRAEHSQRRQAWMEKIRREGFDPNVYQSCQSDFESLQSEQTFTEDDVEEYAYFEHAAWKFKGAVWYEESGRSHFQDALLQCGIHHRFFVTDTGRVGMGPKEAQAGDVIAILFGSSVPFLLRPTDNAFKVVGSCYCYTFMEGQYYKALVANGTLQQSTTIFKLQ